MPPASFDPADPRFLRQRILEGFGDPAQARLAAAHAVVIGAGGLGAALLPSLAGTGVGRITIIDDDTIELSNLHRQTLFADADLGRPKAEVAAAALRKIAPSAEIVPVVGRFAEGGALDLVLDADLLIDGSDDPATRFLANDIAAVRGIPLVWGSALGWHGQAGVAWDDAGVDYRDLTNENTASTADCATTGVLPAVCTVIGGIMAAEAVKLLTGVGEPLLGRVVMFDARSGAMRELNYRRDPGAIRPGSIEEKTREFDPTESLSVDSLELAALLDTDAPPMLIDVREPHEHSYVAIPGSTLIPLRSLVAGIESLEKDTDIVLYCHHGARSGQALGAMRNLGFTHVRHLAGGIDAYARVADPGLPRY